MPSRTARLAPPGNPPVMNVTRTLSFARDCGAAIPDWFAPLFDGLDNLGRWWGAVSTRPSFEATRPPSLARTTEAA